MGQFRKKMTKSLPSFALVRLLLTPLCLTVAACGARTTAPVASGQPASSSAPGATDARGPNRDFVMAPAPTVAATTVAVADFEGGNIPADRKTGFWGRALASFMITDLAASQNLRVVDREHLAAVLREQRLSISDLSDNATRVRVGKIIGAKYFIFGTYTIVSGEAALTARMVDVETGQILAADSIGGKANDLRMLSMQLAAKFLRPLDQVVADQEAHSTPNSGGPPSTARDSFEQGLIFERQGQYDKAIDSYTRALTVYPHYTEASDHLEKASEAFVRQ